MKRITCILIFLFLSFTASEVFSQTTIQIGNATTTTATTSASPVCNWYRNYHLQIIYLKSELNAQGISCPHTISQIGFNVTGLPQSALPNYTIKIGHYSPNTLATNYTGAMTTVYTNSSFMPATGWNMLNFSTPFVWNGTDNIIIDICWDQIPSYSSSGSVQYSTTNNKFLYYQSDGTQACPTAVSSTSDDRPNTRFTVTPLGNCTGTPTTGAITATGTPLTLTAPNATLACNMTYQWQSRPNCPEATWTDIPGATNSAYSLSTLNGSTQFRLFIVCNTSGLSDTSAGYLINSLPQNYCSSAATSSADEIITEVVIPGKLINNSTCGSVAGPGSILNQYSDYTTLVPPAQLEMGATYPFSTTIGTCNTNNYHYSSGLAAWIDFNGNGTFESAERIFASSGTTLEPYSVSGTFTVPANSFRGNVRMRVICVESTSGTSINPCGTYTYGETEDYLVNIQYVPSASGGGVFCSGDSTALIAAAPGVANPNFLWLGPNGFTDTSRILIMNNLQTTQSGIYKLMVLYYPCNGTGIPDTSGVLDVTVGVNQTPKKPIVAPVITYCQGDVFDSIPIFGQNLQWFTVPTGGIPGPAPIINTSVFSTATYYVSQTVDGCQSQRAEVTIKVVAKPDPPQVTSPIGFCQGAPALPLQATGQQIRWYSVPAGGVGTPNTPVPSTAAQGTTTWYATQTVEGCESERVPVIVHVSYMPNGQILASRPVVCQTDTLTFKYFGNATDSANYVWTLPTGASLVSGQGQQIIVRFDSAGIQTVKLAVDNNGCAGVAATFDVTVHPTPVVALDFQPDACAGDVISVALSYASMGIDSLAWDFQAGEQVYGAWPKGPFGIRWSEQGLKTVSVVAASRGCISEPATERIHIHGLPDAGITAGTQTGCAGDSILFRAVYEPGATYQWQPAQFFAPGQGPEAWATVLHASMIRLDVVNRYNCKASDSIFVNAQPCCQVYFPTAFSPNGDGTNDYFKMLTLGKEKTAQSKAHQLSVFKVQNRWGQTIFETADETRGWDGTFNGVAQDIGTYYFYVRYKCSDGKFYEQKGEVTLVR